MTIADAARATRKYFVMWHGLSDAKVWQVFVDETGEAVSDGFSAEGDAQAACDHLNLLAVLEALREPSENVARAARETADVESSYYESDVYNRWRAMIDALIAEVRKSDEHI